MTFKKKKKSFFSHDFELCFMFLQLARDKVHFSCHLQLTNLNSFKDMHVSKSGLNNQTSLTKWCKHSWLSQ